MIFTKYSTAKEFADDTLDILKKYEIQNNLVFKNIDNGLAKDNDSSLSYELVMATVKDDNGDVLLTGIRTVPFPFVIFATDNIVNNDALELFAISLAQYNINIDIVMSEKELAKRFCDLYANHIGKSFYCHENLVLYLLEKVNDLKLVDGKFRKANESDMYYLPYWVADFAPACNISEYNLNQGIESAKRQIDKDMAYIFEDKIPVSLASHTRKVTNCAVIGQVYTPPVFRGKGYSTACVAILAKNYLMTAGNTVHYMPTVRIRIPTGYIKKSAIKKFSITTSTDYRNKINLEVLQEFY